MKRKVVFVILHQFADWEYAPLAAELHSPDIGGEAFEVLFASDTLDPKTSIGNIKAMPDLSIADIPEDAAALILVGGNSWRKPAAKVVAPVAQRFLDEGRTVGAICDAARFLGAHGLLNHHRHTVNDPSELAEESAYTNAAGFLQQDTVRDGKLVTANGTAPYAFAREVLLALGREEASAQQWYDFQTLGLHAALKKHGLQLA